MRPVLALILCVICGGCAMRTRVYHGAYRAEPWRGDVHGIVRCWVDYYDASLPLGTPPALRVEVPCVGLVQ